MHIRHMRLVAFAALLIASTSVTASVTLFVDGKAISGKGTDGRTIAFPDICITPVPIVGVVPIPYPNIATSSDKTATTKVKTTTKEPVVSATKQPVSNDGQLADTVLYRLEARRGGRLHIQQRQATEPVTEATYVDHTGKAIRLQEPALIELANGEYCAVCASKGKVTAVYRLVSIAPREKSTDTSSR